MSGDSLPRGLGDVRPAGAHAGAVGGLPGRWRTWASSPSGSGEHLLLRVEKRGANTALGWLSSWRAGRASHRWV
jgi:hypothetical protein